MPYIVAQEVNSPMYRQLRYQDRIQNRIENLIALGKMIDAPATPRQTTLEERIWTSYNVQRTPDAEARLSSTSHIWLGKLVAGQDASTVNAWCEREGWQRERNAANVWTGPTGRCKLWDDGSIMFIVPAAETAA